MQCNLASGLMANMAWHYSICIGNSVYNSVGEARTCEMIALSRAPPQNLPPHIHTPYDHLQTFAHDVFPLWHVSPSLSSALHSPRVENRHTWVVVVFFSNETNFLQVKNHILYFIFIPYLINRHMEIEIDSVLQCIGSIEKWQTLEQVTIDRQICNYDYNFG